MISRSNSDLELRKIDDPTGLELAAEQREFLAPSVHVTEHLDDLLHGSRALIEAVS